jgi:hypothetical protein
LLCPDSGRLAKGLWAPKWAADSTGRRNTSIVEVFSDGDGGLEQKTSDVPEGVRRQWRADRALRPAMRSPGRPEPSRAVQRQFWRLIATGITSAEAALAVGVSVPVGTRWFRHAGGMPPISLAEPTAATCPSRSVRRSRSCAPGQGRA